MDDDECTAKRIMKHKLIGNRKIGSLKTRWLDQVGCDVRKLGSVNWWWMAETGISGGNLFWRPRLDLLCRDKDVCTYV